MAKIQLDLKDPNGVYHSMKRYMDGNENCPEDIEDAVSKYVKYQEYVTIEIDTETGEARVLPV